MIVAVTILILGLALASYKLFTKKSKAKKYDDAWPVYATEEYAKALYEYQENGKTALAKVEEAV